MADILNGGQLVSPTSRMVLQIAENRTMRTMDILACVRGHATSEDSSPIGALLRTKCDGPQVARPHGVTRASMPSSLSVELGPFQVSLGVSQRRCRWQSAASCCSGTQWLMPSKFSHAGTGFSCSPAPVAWERIASHRPAVGEGISADDSRCDQVATGACLPGRDAQPPAGE